MLHNSIVLTPGMEAANRQQLEAVRAHNERRLAELVAGHQAELGQVFAHPKSKNGMSNRWPECGAPLTPFRLSSCSNPPVELGTLDCRRKAGS
jgi:hypothetical protein